MRPNQCTIPVRWPARGVRRRGVSAVTLVVVMVLMVGLAALSLDMGLIAFRHQQLQFALDAAALAGAAQLMDPAPLVGWSEAEARRRTIDRVALARETARQFARWNLVGAQPLELSDNRLNRADGDVVAGWLTGGGDLREPMVVWDGLGPVNSVTVQVSSTRLGGNPFSFRIGSAFGLQAADTQLYSRAVIDQRVIGVRAAGAVPVPLVPIVYVRAAEPSDGTLRSRALTFAGQQDEFAVNPRTGEVRPGDDGVPELVLRIVVRPSEDRQSSRTHGNAGWLSLAGARRGDLTGLQRGLQRGFVQADLAEVGGELRVFSAGGLRVPAEFDGELRELEQLRAALWAARGQPRIWPLATAQDPGLRDGLCCLVDFAAGCLVDCRCDDEQGLTLIVQPCTLQTGTAVLAIGADQNPWIGKLVLN